MSNDTDAFLTQYCGQPANCGFVGLEILSLGLCKGSLGNEGVLCDHERRELW